MYTTATAPTFEQVRQACQAAGIAVAHLITADCAIVPSATTRDMEYILVRVAGAWRCNCPAAGRCWHQDRAAQLAAAAVPAPVLYCEAQDAYLVPDAAPAPVVDKQARYRAAYADVFGTAA
jgi:hypothetical protein